MIHKKLQEISTSIFGQTGIPLFVNMPADELESIKKDVEDEDSFTIRLNAICNLIDRINKKHIDKFTTIRTDGSRKSLIYLLKKLFPNEHNFIDAKIDNTLGMIFLLRAYHTHHRNINIQKAYSFFEFDNPITNFCMSWQSVFIALNQVLDDILYLFKVKYLADFRRQQEIDEELKSCLEKMFVNENSDYFDDENIKKMLLYILSEERIIDTELAEKFGMDVVSLRESLLPLIPNTLWVRYHDNESTQIGIREHAKMILKKYYFKE